MTQSFQLLDVVALLTDDPQHNLVQGQVGTIVEVLDSNTFEVEFSDQDSGQTYALIPLASTQLMRLYHHPVNVKAA